MELLQLAVLVVVAYLMGAIPNGLIIARLAGRDILRHGSGKLGATNTMSAVGRWAAAVVGGLDLAKGALSVLMAQSLTWPEEEWAAIAVGAAVSAAIAGNNWSVWVRLLAGMWGGGRGIAVALGAMLLVHTIIVLAAIAVGAATLVASRYVVIATIAGIMAGAVAAFLLLALGQISPWLLPGIVAWCLVVTLGFHDNIRRLVAGTETRLGRQPLPQSRSNPPAGN